MAAQQPTYRAYTVVKREGQDDFWLTIGAAFMHQDGDGLQRRPAGPADQTARSSCARRNQTPKTPRCRALSKRSATKMIGARVRVATSSLR